MADRSRKRNSSHKKHRHRSDEDDFDDLEEPQLPNELSLWTDCNISESNVEENKNVEQIGPALPPHLRNQHQDKSDEDCEDVCGPALPPGFDLKSDDSHTYGPTLPSAKGISSKEHELKSETLGPTLEYNQKEDLYGPVLPTNCKKTESESIGPALPPGFKTSDDYGPALPPPSSNDRSDRTVENEASVMGPALPPGFIKSSQEDDCYGPALPPSLQTPHMDSYGPSASACSDEDSEDEEDDVMGPLPYTGPSIDSSAAEEFEKRAERMKDKILGKNEEIVVRESWMTELPPEMKAFGLGPRKFRANAAPEKGDRSVWTDTPADREKKQKEGKTGSKRQHEELAVSDRDIRLNDQITKFNKSNRSESLMDMHSKKMKKKKESEEDKPTVRRPFDREADLKTNHFDDSQRRAIIKKSQKLNTKFGHGSSQYL